jgi:peptidoglycan/LPS O-acetylase OafA/YrhL
MNLFSKLKIGEERYPALTGARAVCASIVFFDHFPFTAGSAIMINILAFFFGLSGFLITRLYYNNVVLSGKGWRDFFVKRFARIYPVYFLVLTVAIVLGHNFRPLFLIKNYTLTHALFFNIKDYAIQQSWSLTVEECFYFSAPFIILGIRKAGFVFSLLCTVVLTILALFISKLPISFLHTPTFVFSTTYFGHFFEFFAGVFLAVIMIKREDRGKGRQKGFAWTLAGFAGITILIAAMLQVYQVKPLNLTAIIVINNFVIPIPIAMLFYGLMCEDTLLSRLLSGKAIGVFGKSSYSFYLIHMITITYIGIPLLLPYFGHQRALCVIVTYILTYAISIGIFASYEEPLNYFIRKKLIGNNKPAKIKQVLPVHQP